MHGALVHIVGFGERTIEIEYLGSIVHRDSAHIQHRPIRVKIIISHRLQ
jgi:hypothetical protein